LRLDPFIRRNYQQHEIDAAYASEHVAHKTLVPGDINESEPNPSAIRSRELEMSKSDVDGDAASFFLFEAIGIDSGQRFHERCFAMINMSGGPHNHGLHLR
jgi:hypothetical protein